MPIRLPPDENKNRLAFKELPRVEHFSRCEKGPHCACNCESVSLASNPADNLQVASCLSLSPRHRYAKALDDFPKLNLIFAHLGHDRHFGQGADAEVVELAQSYPGVHADVSLRLIEVVDGHVSAEDLVAHLRAIGTDRVLFGSNWVISEYLWMRARAGVTPDTSHVRLDRELDVLKSLPLTDEERADLASRNFRRLTGMAS